MRVGRTRVGGTRVGGTRAGQAGTGLLAAVLCLLVVPGGAVHAQELAPPTYTVDEAALPFAALPGTDTERTWGVLDGAGYRIEKPADWNGELVLYSHGFVSPTQTELVVDIPPLRAYLLSQGYAWAASSYSENGYVIETGIEDTQALNGLFAEAFEPADRTYTTGVSMGGHIVGAMIERYPDAYAGALPLCGVMGDAALNDYFLGHAAAAQTLAEVEASVPPPADYLTAVMPAVTSTLGYGPGLDLEGPGHQLSAVTETLSGGERPLFDQAFDYWSDTAAVGGLPFLLGVYGGALTGGPATAAQPYASNADQTYQLDDDPAVSAREQALNAAVPRVGRSGGAPFPLIEGTLGNGTKVLTMHTIGDLFVPFSMQQVYRQEAIAAGTDGRLVQRAVRDVGHCAFTPQEGVRAFSDLVTWVEDDVTPAGDDILDPAVVADRDFGCAFSAGVHLGIPACGTAPRVERLAGADRVQTALSVAAARYDSAETVVVATAGAYADALTGAPLAARLDAPLLLTGSEDLPAAVADQITALGATQAYVLGGPSAVSEGIVTQLTEAGITSTVRLGGADRFDTARLIAEVIGGDAAYVVAGTDPDPRRGWPDAVSVSGLAAFLERPVLLVEQSAVPAATAAAVTSLGLESVTVVGGSAAVSAQVEAALEDSVSSVDRVAGDDRYATSAGVARLAIGAGMQAGTTVVANGSSFPDSLVAGSAAGAGGDLFVLVDDDAASVEPTVALLDGLGATVGDLDVVGGTAALSEDTVAALRSLLAG